MSEATSTDAILDRVPPSDLMAERALLAILFVNPEAILETADYLEVEEFYSEPHRIVYEDMLDLTRDHRPVDHQVIVTRIRDKLAKVVNEPIAWLGELFESWAPPTSRDYYMRRIRAAYVLRSLSYIGAATVRAADDRWNPKTLPSDVEEAIQEAIHDLRRLDISDPGEDWSAKTGDEFRDRLDALQRGNWGGFVSTGFWELDRKVGGFQDGTTTVLAARPGVGKSAMACQIAASAAEAGRRVALFSLEMDRVEIVARIVKQNLGVSDRDFELLDDEKRAQMRRTLLEIDRWPLRIWNRRVATVEQIAARLESGMVNFSPELLIVDYLQIIQANDPRGRRFEQIAQIVRDVVDLAKRRRIPILALAQLNREADKDDKPPRLSHLRESGAIETEADVVWLLHRPGSDAELIVAKNRYGETGSVKLTWNVRRTGFESMDYREAVDAFD